MSDSVEAGTRRRGASPRGRTDGTARFEPWIDEALGLADQCLPAGDVPVGAVVLDASGAVIGRGRNVREELLDPLGHAEVRALSQAAQTREGWRLDGCTLVVTLEPCPMCAGAAMQARIDRIVFGAWDEKAGACGSVWDLVRDPRALHRIEVVGGVAANRCAALLTDFFDARR